MMWTFSDGVSRQTHARTRVWPICPLQQCVHVELRHDGAAVRIYTGCNCKSNTTKRIMTAHGQAPRVSPLQGSCGGMLRSLERGLRQRR